MKPLKTIFLSTLCFITLLTLFACKESSDSDSESSSANEILNNSICTIPSDYPIWSSYDDYLEFLATTKLPKCFVSYDMLTEFGDFDSFELLGYPDNIDYTRYLYRFRQGISLHIDFVYPTFRAERTSTTAEINPNDMRKLIPNDYNLSQSYIYNDNNNHRIEYRYNVHGDLTEINWQTHEVYYRLSSQTSLDLDCLPFTKRFMDLENVPKLMTELEEQLPEIDPRWLILGEIG